MVKTHDNIVQWMLIPHSNPAVDEQFIFTGGNAARVLSGGYAYQEFDTWEVTSGPQALSNFNGIDGTLNSQVIGPGSCVTISQKQKGQIPASSPTLHRTDYEYDTSNRLTKVIGPAIATGQPRPETTYVYDSAGLLVSSTDPLGQTTTYTYDSAKRLVTTTYPDSTTEQTLYGTGANAGRVIKTKDRMGMVTTMTYDSSGLLTQQVASAAIDANILDGNPDDQTITDPNSRRITQYTYLPGSNSLKSSVTVNGAKTDYTYDYHNRVLEVKQQTSNLWPHRLPTLVPCGKSQCFAAACTAACHHALILVLISED